MSVMSFILTITFPLMSTSFSPEKAQTCIYDMHTQSFHRIQNWFNQSYQFPEPVEAVAEGEADTLSLDEREILKSLALQTISDTHHDWSSCTQQDSRENNFQCIPHS